jgi:ATP-dependent helicase/nuclease subunit B
MRARRLDGEDFTKLRHLLRPLTEAWGQALPLEERIAAHIEVAEALAASESESGAERLWGAAGGEDIAACVDEWRESASGFPAIGGGDYEALFATLAAAKIMRSARATHPRLSILGPLEARLVDAELVILGGMNEGVWPPDAGFDPWMSRAMRKKFDLPSPEFRIGLSAHDFAQLACTKEVLLTRALRAGGNPSVPSRFLLQLDAVLRAAGLSDDRRDALAAKEPWREWAQALDAPEEGEKGACARPQPRPPAEARPAALSVTEISTWLRNPYAIYARHVLRLKKLEELDAAPDAAERGVMIHAA